MQQRYKYFEWFVYECPCGFHTVNKAFAIEHYKKKQCGYDSVTITTMETEKEDDIMSNINFIYKDRLEKNKAANLHPMDMTVSPNVEYYGIRA